MRPCVRGGAGLYRSPCWLATMTHLLPSICGRSAPWRRKFAVSILLSWAALLSCAAEVAPQGPNGGPASPSASPGWALRQPDGEKAARRLSRGAVAAGEIPAGGVERFEIELRAGEFLRLRISKRDAGVRLVVFAPGDTGARAEFDSRLYGPLRAAFIADVAGPHLLELRLLEAGAEGVGYELKVEEVRTATALDKRDAMAAAEAADAERLRAEWGVRSLRAATGKYASAANLWRAAHRHEEAVDALIQAGDVSFSLSDYAAALSSYTRALRWSRAAGLRRGRLSALNAIGYGYVYLGENQKALGYFDKVNEQCEREPASGTDENRRLRARVLNNFGEVYYSLSDYDKALDFFSRADELWQSAGDRRGDALARLNLGYTYNDTGRLRLAAKAYEESLALWHAVGDLRGEALCRTALGGLHALRGEGQLALDNHLQAARLFRALGDRSGEAASYNGLGYVYDGLNETRLALDYYERSLALYRAVGNRDFEALTLNSAGRLYHALGDDERAFEHFRESIRLSRAVGDRQVEAAALRDAGAVYDSREQSAPALKHLAEALRLFRESGNRRGQAVVLNLIGQVEYRAGQPEKADADFRAALEIFEAMGETRGQVSALLNLARAARDRGALDEARAFLEGSIGVIESTRVKITNQELRASYFTSVRRHYELYIDVLMQLHARRPGAGFDSLALQASERARARSLVEMLNEAGVEARRDADPELLAREASLRQALADKSEYRARLLSGSHTEEQAERAAEEMRRLMADYREAQSRLMESNPAYAALARPTPLSAEEIRGLLHDDDELLLEYALGEERSYLWAVTRTDVSSFELPGRRTIEEAGRAVYELLTARQPASGESAQQYLARVGASDALYGPRADALSRLLLGPVAGRIGGKRLLVVGDGVLQYIPFEALPVGTLTGGQSPDGEPAAPLILRNEVITLPSASTLAALRSQRATRADAAKTVVVFADPVFEAGDPRLRNASRMQASSAVGAEGRLSSLRGLEEFGGGDDNDSPPRLISTLREARAIMAAVPDGNGVMATGFDANRAAATGEVVGRASVVHFATHGVLNSEYPALSGVLLSRLDETGQAREGVLHLQDVYNLNLSADLVVLSACRTALGKNVSGEGVIGLTRGFMYAGAKGVVASLWKVDDEATAELMGHFYHALLRDGVPPAAALRAAKLALRKQERWRAPYYWAAFVLQGEYNAPVRASDSGRRPWRWAVAALIAALALGAVLISRRAQKRRRTARFG